MNHLVVLVGPMGSGKSSIAAGKYASYIHINQDNQGKEGHFTEYKKALALGQDIVVDRINHTKEQRARYISLAKASGYITEIVTLNEPYHICYNRIMARYHHPTLKADPKAATNALNTYFNQYEYPLDNESDVVTRGEYDPYLLDITERCKNKRVIIVGDLHGCYDELLELLTVIKWKRFDDVLIFTGDIIDKGPKINECLQFFLAHMIIDVDVYTVMSNHDNKLLRYLRGNKVSLPEETISQCKETINSSYLRHWIENIPYIIKWDTNSYVLHAGINPTRDILSQTKEFLMYARTFDKQTLSFNNPDAPSWSSFPIKDKIYHGHVIQPNYSPTDNVFPLDGGCMQGGTLRAFIRDVDGGERVVEVKAKRKYYNGISDYSEGFFSEYDRYVESGYLSKKEEGDLVLYNYTDKCMYERVWNNITTQCRGLIFNKKTKECVARPFKKFFNINEMSETTVENLPNEPYEIFDKCDGSLGILFWLFDEYNDPVPHIATRGSFNSDQAIEAMKIIKEKYQVQLQINFYYFKDITLLFEIIYPENTHNPNGRLVVNYGNMRDVVLLAAIHRKTGEEVSRPELEELAKKVGFRLVDRYSHTIDEAIEMQKALPIEKEGFVIRFQSGLRVKIKGEEYKKRQKLLSQLNPKSLLSYMQYGKIDIQSFPEELHSIIQPLVIDLEVRYLDIFKAIVADADVVKNKFGQFDPSSGSYRRHVGLFLKEAPLTHNSVIFPYIDNNKDTINKYILKILS